ncbi:hypothetical protein GOP47_0024696 [Adiantum capillus-veneris]|uniref:Phosphoglycerate kinase n=1 Tax=Adiantum capillus-veneris TaxID=13818 RepID=A0A9D4U281_ADICA|nr:hypothetical protein GOP47_0024696 [Adiantum capillus-veneris]
MLKSADSGLKLKTLADLYGEDLVRVGCFELFSIRSFKSVDRRVHRKEERRRGWDTLREYPREDLLGKAVLVRLDLSACIDEVDGLNEEAILTAIPTLSYLISAGARIVITSHWPTLECSNKASNIELIAGCFSQHLGKTVSTINAVKGGAVQNAITTLSNGDLLLLGNLEQYKEELSNDKEYSKELAANIDVLVNDAFSIAHRILASTVGVTCFTSARLAGLQLEKELLFLTKATSTPAHPFVAIIGGSRLSQTLNVLNELLKTCSSIVITGSIVFMFFKALGYRCFSSFTEDALVPDVVKFLNSAAAQKVDVILPLDLLCIKEGFSHATFRPDNVPEGWVPVSVGQSTLERIENALLGSKMALWIGPLSLSNIVEDNNVSKSLAKIFSKISRQGCITIVGGRQATSAIRADGESGLISHISTGGAAFMEFLKGMNLPAVSALDFACPGKLEWERIYSCPSLPLVIDVGCGNGLFILRMARTSVGSLNFLGLEVRKKLVDQCLTSVTDDQADNVHFVEADAATMFKRIVSSYPGKIILVAIQCPVPNFTNTETRRRMVQKQLVEQILHTISTDGKIFLQSDVKSVAMQLRKDFLEYEKGRLRMSIEHHDAAKCDSEGWLLTNPLGVSSDWEDHVLQRGDQMFRVLLSCFSNSH